MSTTLTGTFEVAGKVDGDSITSGDAGALTAWDTVGGSAKYSSNAGHGSLSCKFLGSGSLRWESGGALPAGQNEVYIRSVFNAHDISGGVVSCVPIAFLCVSARGNDWCYITQGADAKIHVWDRAGNQVGVSSGTYAADTFHRLEAHATVDAGDGATASSVVVRVYTGKDDSTIAETITCSGIDLGSAAHYFGAGIFAFSATNEFRIDDYAIQFGAGATWLGPNATAPVADFTGTPLAIQTGETVTFSDASSNTPTTWAWQKDSGGGFVNFAGTPTVQNPTETFAAAGTYAIKLTVTNSAGSDAKTRTAYVVVSDPLISGGPGSANEAAALMAAIL